MFRRKIIHPHQNFYPLYVFPICFFQLLASLSSHCHSYYKLLNGQQNTQRPISSYYNHLSYLKTCTKVPINTTKLTRKIPDLNPSPVKPNYLYSFAWTIFWQSCLLSLSAFSNQASLLSLHQSGTPYLPTLLSILLNYIDIVKMLLQLFQQHAPPSFLKQVLSLVSSLPYIYIYFISTPQPLWSDS